MHHLGIPSQSSKVRHLSPEMRKCLTLRCGNSRDMSMWRSLTNLKFEFTFTFTVEEGGIVFQYYATIRFYKMHSIYNMISTCRGLT